MLSPKDYPERIALLDLAAVENINTDNIKEFLWLVNARPDLVGLGEVVRVLAEVVNFSEATWPSILKEFNLEWLPGLLSDLRRLFESGFCFPPAGFAKRIHRLHRCPPQTVRIWMGHAMTGDEPWSRHATFNYAEHRVELSRYLLPILKDLGFEPICGERK